MGRCLCNNNDTTKKYSFLRRSGGRGRKSESGSGWKLGDSLPEGTRTLIYGIGILLLAAGVIIGIVSLIVTLSIGNTAAALNWGMGSMGLVIVGIIVKVIGTKIPDGYHLNK